jgi:hypothetical protein
MVNRVELEALMSDALGRMIEAAGRMLDDQADTAREPPGPRYDRLQRMHVDYDLFGSTGGNALVLRDVLGWEPRALHHHFQELAAL